MSLGDWINEVDEQKALEDAYKHRDKMKEYSKWYWRQPCSMCGKLDELSDMLCNDCLDKEEEYFNKNIDTNK
jgi:hypothetical protein